MDVVSNFFRRGFAIKLALVVLLIALGDWLFWQQKYGVGNFGLYGLAILVSLILARPATLRSWQGIAGAVATALYCGAIVFNAALLAIVFFWTAITITALVPYASRFKDGWQWFWRLALHAVVAPFMPIVDAAKLKKALSRKGPRKFGLRESVGLLAIPVIGGTIFFCLFALANPVLERLVASWKLPPLDEMLIIRMVVWGIIAVMVWSLFRPWRRRGPALTTTQATPIDFNLASIASITLSLVVFNVMFLMQNAMDLAFMSGVVPLPDDMGLADYAHRGAHPLIATAMLAALFVLVMLRPESAAANNKLVRLLVTIWIVQNVVLVISSMIRAVDYIEAYSLTLMRIAALAWMVLVGVGLALICWRLLRGKTGGWLINANLLVATLVLTGFCFIDARAVAASWNVTHAREVGGRGVQLDLCYMSLLGAGAIGPLMDLEQKPLPLAFRTRVNYVRSELMAKEVNWLKTGGWSWQLEQRINAANARLSLLPVIKLEPGPRDCHGALWVESSASDPID